MYDQLSFIIGNKTITVGTQTFDLGVLSTEILNLDISEYRDLDALAEAAQQDMNACEGNDDPSAWKKSYEKWMELDRRMASQRIFRLIKNNSPYLDDLAHFLDDPNAPYSVPSDNWLGIAEEFMPKTYLEVFGSVDTVWSYYRSLVRMYRPMLDDCAFFNDTVGKFINRFLSSLDTLNSQSYAAALYDFFTNPYADKLISNPIRGTGLFTMTDPVSVTYFPCETHEGSGDFQIYERYTTASFQALLKADFYHALQIGYTIRRCECCERYFLQKKGYRTKYCDQPNPSDPKHTCAQIGRKSRGIKELKKDDPKVQALRRCLDRIDSDTYNGCITEKERSALKKKAENMLLSAKRNPNQTVEEFNESLQSKNLYPLCGVVRKSKPRGRPKKSGGEA